MELQDKVFIDKDNKRYIVIEKVTFDDRYFAFLMNSDNEQDSKFVEVIIDHNQPILKQVDRSLFKLSIFPLFLEKFQNY